jgi:integrase
MSRGKILKRTWAVCPIHGMASKKCRQEKCTAKKTRRSAFLFEIVVDGKRVTRQFASRQEAIDALEQFKVEQRNPAPPPAPASRAFGEVVDRYLALQSRRRTVDEFQRVARHLVDNFGKDTPVAAITPERIDAYRAQRLTVTRNGNPLTLAAIQRPLGLLRTILKTAHRWKAISELPSFKGVIVKEPLGDDRYLSQEEAVRLLAACRASRNTALADVVELALFTGMRRGEVIGLTWDRVDRARGVVRLLTINTKNGKNHEVKLNANADAVLARRWTDGARGLVFHSDNWDSYKHAWEMARRDAKLDAPFRFHHLRHTFCSWLVIAGRSLREVCELANHSDISMTMRYAHLAPEHLRDAVSALDGIIPVSGSNEPSRAANRAATARREVVGSS